MNGMSFIIDFLGNIFEIYIVLEFFKLIFSNKRVTRTTNLIFMASIIISFILSEPLKNHLVLTTIIALLVYFGISCVFSEKILIRIFACLLIYSLFLAFDIMSGIILSKIFDVSISTTQKNIVYYLLGVFLSKFGGFIFIKIISLKRRIKTDNINPIILVMLIFFPISSIFVICTIAFFTYTATEYTLILLSSISIISLILSNVFVFYVFERQSELEQAKSRLDFVQTQMGLQKEHYEELYNSQQETRRIWHDMKNSLMAITGYLETGENDKAITYIENFTGMVSKTIYRVDTGCPAIDAILNSKKQRAENLGASLQSKIVLPQNLYIDSIDFAVLLANGLDNAIEAVKKMDKSKRTIRLNILPREDYIFIKISNPILENLDTVNLKTEKLDKLNHGFGLKNIHIIAEKYYGNVNIECKELMFDLSVLLQNKKSYTFAV